MRTFDSLAIELAGRNLIEASAGTGKTYAIASLYVRLLVEQGLLPENILVVTFTEAATKELRDRIRQRIRAARDVFAGLPAADDLLSGMVQTVAGDGRAQALERLEAALQTFDCAAIATIHGFCHRALQENAFESGSLYDTELTALPAPLIKRLVDDYWRLNFFGAAADILPLVEAAAWSPETFAGFLKGKLANPELEIVPRFSAAEIEQSAVVCRAAYADAAMIWRERKAALTALLLGDEGLRRSAETFRQDILDVMLAEMDSYLLSGNPYRLFRNFERFTASFIAGQQLKKKDPPTDPFFDCCQRLADSINTRKLAVLWELFVYVSTNLPRTKAHGNIRFYDDLLTDLLAALRGRNGKLLAGKIRSRFKAALIDEFQDTDQVQYRIFREIFADDEVPLFMIGDPKQAIYSFRGADIFAYLAAKDDIPAARQFTMDRNWRSTPQLVDAVNLLFSRQPLRPLLFAGLDYPPVTAAGREQPLLAGERDAAPLQLWFMGREEGSSKPLELGRSRRQIVVAVADEVAALLADAAQGRATVAAAPLAPADIAVIVRSHGQARLFQEELAGRGIAAVVRSNASIFAAAEAHDLCTLLGAVVEPAREVKVRTALVTTLLGMSGNDIARLQEETDTAAWEQWLARFRDYHDIWRTRGFMVMFRKLLAREGVRGRLLAMPAGDRRLTNVLHLSELLHGEESSASLGMDALYTWFCHQVSSPPENDEYQIRLESDEQAVRILTIHVSKGLEFPIVFSPFAWGGVHGNDDTVFCHEDGRMVADFGSADYALHRKLAREEALAENIRLLYVAVTRAKYRCYLVWGRFRHVESSALAYLLHGPQDEPAADILGYLQDRFEGISDDELLQPLQAMTRQLAGVLTVTVNPAVAGDTVPPAAAAPPVLHCAALDRRIEAGWQVSSFSSLAGGHPAAAEFPGHDDGRADAARSAGEPLPEGSIFALPRGARAGTFLHGIFEKVDFAAATAASLRDLVSEALGRSAFAGKWHEAVSTMVEQAITVPLGAAAGSFPLAALAPQSWVVEMEFYFPLKFISSGQLAALLQKHDPDGRAGLAGVAAMLDFREAEGMVHGFVDLVFSHHGRYYLLDWKSNHLGNRVEDYGPEQLARAMTNNLYRLQYLLYTVALNRYLQNRDPAYCYEDNFGGVFYLFLRGIDASRPEYGVFHDVPDASLVQELTACLVDCEGG